MKKLFGFTKKKKNSSGTSDNVSALSDGYELKDKDLGKIHKAALQADLAKLKQLLKKNDVNQVDKESRTALHVACATGHAEVVQLLVDSKAKLDLRDNQHRSALMKAVQGQHEGCLTILLENGASPNLEDINGNTALHLAANIPSLSMAGLLLHHGAEINAQNKEGFTPLTVAVREDRLEMAEFLLKETADVNSLDREHRSPLMLAAGGGQHRMVKLLLQFQPDVTIQDDKGWSADDYAVRNGHNSCCLLITEHGTKQTPRASVSHPGPSKKKNILAFPSQDVDTSFSLGGPATNKERGTNEAGGDLEDDSLSESVSRASKSANDEWPSTEDEDESAEKKPSKISQIFGSKMGKAPVLPETSRSDTESEEESETGVQRIPASPQHPVDLPAVSSLLPKSPRMASTPLPSARKGESSLKGVKGERYLGANNSQQAASVSEDSEEDAEEEEIEEEEEEEEEEDDDEEEEEEESVESDESEEEEENEAYESEAEGSTVDYTTADAQNAPYTDSPPPTGSAVKLQINYISEKSDKAEAENTDLNRPDGAQSFARPATLDVAEDCIVSAIRVESKLSDEDEECMKPSHLQINPNQCPTERWVRSPGRIKDVGSDRETGDEDKDSLSDKQNSADSHDDQGGNEEEGMGGSALIALPRSLLAKVGENTESDVEDHGSSEREPFKRRSSWGSSMEGSDADEPEERQADDHVLQQEQDVPALGKQQQAASLPPEVEQHATSLESSSPLSPSAKPGLQSSPEARIKPAAATAGESDWDSSEADNQEDPGAKYDATSADSQAAAEAHCKVKHTHQFSLEEEDRHGIYKESSDPSLVAPENESPKQAAFEDGEPAASFLKMEERFDSEKEEGGSSSWEDESADSEKQLTSLPTDVNLPSLNPEDGRSVDEKDAKTDFIQADDNKVIPCSLIDGRYDGKDETKAQGEQMHAGKIQSKDSESSEDSDSKHQKLQYSFASATIKPLDVPDSVGATGLSGHVGGRSVDESEARLTSFAPLENKTGKTGGSYDDGRSKDLGASGQLLSSEVSDEALPQTDIDDVDLSSSDPSENTSMRFPELKHTAETDVQQLNSTEDEDEQEGDEEDHDNQSEDGGKVCDAASTLHKAEGGQVIERDFRSELGLTTEEEEESPWDSEPNSELSNIPHKEEQDLDGLILEEKPALQDPLKENMFYIPSFLRGKGCSRMAEVCVGTPQGSQGEAGKDGKQDVGGGADKDATLQKKSESPKRELRRIFSKPKEEMDIGEELGVGDVDDLEDGSDWDSTSIPSKGALPGYPELKEFQEDANSSGSEQIEDAAPAGTPTQSAPQPRPRVRMRIPQKPDSEEESDSEPEKTTGSEKKSLSDNQLQNVAEQLAGSAELSVTTGNTERGLDFEDQQVKDNKGAEGGCDFSLQNLGPAGSDTEEQDDDGLKEKSGGDKPWEKRYENLWVELEKKEVKSSFKSVAGELKEKFGEMLNSGSLSEKASPASSSADDDSSEEVDEEVTVGPAARATSTVLLTRQEGSALGPPDHSMCEERWQDCDQAVRDHKSALITADVPGASSSQLSAAQEREEHLNQRDKTKTQLHEAGRSISPSGSEPPLHLDVSNREGHDEEDVAKFTSEIISKPAAKLEEGKPLASWDSSETGGKPETCAGSRMDRAEECDQEQLFPSKRAAVQQSSKRKEKPGVAGRFQMELQAPGPPSSGAPQTCKHEDPFSVFEESPLSDVSDDEKRLLTRRQQKRKMQKPEDIDTADDLDELTESSDTATDDMDSPTSGYRHASLLMQRLTSSTFDSTSITKLQNIFHEYERAIEKVKSRHGYLEEKVSHLEMEREALKGSLEEVKDAKSLLERNQLELQTQVTNLKFQLKQEQENRHNATMMYNATRDKLRRLEEQHQMEVQEKQKVELTLRNVELDMRTLISNAKQLEEEHAETQRLLAQERSTRALQENLLNSHLRKQQEMEVENKRIISSSSEALSQLTEASDRERELLQQTASLQEQLSMLRTDLERSQANGELKESHLLEENETLKEQLEDARRDLKISNDSVAQTVFTCHNQLAALKAELAKTASRLENERQARETLEAEVESTRSRLAGAVKEAELRLAAHSDSEKTLIWEREEHQRIRDRLNGELASQREAVSSLSQKLAKAEARANSMENEVHRVTLQLTEKGLLLDVLQREKEQAATRTKELENALHAEREQVSRAAARHEATQERLAQAQSEAMLLRQQLEEANNKGSAKERAVTDAQERFTDILSKLRSDGEGRVQMVEDRNKELAAKAADLRDQIYKLEEEKNERETSMRQLQQELADSLKKLSMSEASLEVNTRYRNDLEEEKARLLKDNDRLRGKLDESEDQYVQAERRINSLKSSLGDREKELSSAAQKLQEALSAAAAAELTVKQLEGAVQRLEIENARLEAAAKQQANKIEVLQKGAQEAAMLADSSAGGGVRGRLEDMVTNLQSSKMTLEEQLNKEVQKQSRLSHSAQDSQTLWEEELKSRSKLGLRLAELEKEKGELTSQMEMEKKKAKKMAEQKKAADTRLDQEMKRNMELQKEMYRLRTLLKTAKKKLRDQYGGGAEAASLRLDQGRPADATLAWMKEKVDDLQGQLEKETSRRNQLEKINEQLKDQVASLKGLGRSHDEQERSRRLLEEEVLELRRRLEANQIQREQHRREMEEKAQRDLKDKLEQVNLFLQSQAASQEQLDQLKAANEANLRTQLEQRIQELEAELGRARSGQLESLNQRESELERHRQLYNEEMRQRKSLAAKLDRANSRLSEANSKLLSERSRSFLANGSPVRLSPVDPGAAVGSLNRSFGFPLSPVTERGVEDYLAKMQSELDKNISKELSKAAAELDAASIRLSPVGSAGAAELDPLSRATQQYLEVLKKNRRI
ncbi:uncharacterized protein LOC119773752 [Cyprinodon tularosa]|uniref:uncharacterized protein LOC119773752 n=1 Tax=Cyprinodon tularosa TaxID=77115 RepID=UPI0018E20572|nr:uncharacterized protein LOC119773752 [Cyprinodon tularosa]